MATLEPPRRPFLRDSALAGALVGAALTVERLAPETSVLGAPGDVLDIPLGILYIRLGGETANQHGPSAVHAAVFVLALSVATAWVAHLARETFSTDSYRAGPLVVLPALLTTVLLVTVVGLVWVPFMPPVVWVPLLLVAVAALVVLVTWRRGR